MVVAVSLEAQCETLHEGGMVARTWSDGQMDGSLDSWPYLVRIEEINQDRTGQPLFGHILLMQLFDINQMRVSLVSHQTSVIIVRLQ